MKYKFSKKLVSHSAAGTQPQNQGFGRVSTDHYLWSDYSPDDGWSQPVIEPINNFSLPPNAVAFHYGQQIFEGLKAYRSPEDEIFLFRPEENAKRFQRSAERLAMAPVPVDMFLEGIQELVRVEKAWVPESPGSLYIRPFEISLDAGVSYRASEKYRFCVIVSPVASYFASKDAGITVTVEREYSRAVPGGVGDIKCGGNYAGALAALKKAKSIGAIDCLWLDATSHRYVEEVGTMNLMFAYDDCIVTPELTGTILPGITRKSVIELARSMGIEVKEQRVAIDSVFRDAADGKLKEVFGCGTAAVVSPIQTIIDGDKKIDLECGAKTTASAIKDKLVGIQTGKISDPFGWRQIIVD